MQACLGAGKRDVAFDALSRWLAWQGGDGCAAEGIGSGGTVNSSELGEHLRVGAAPLLCFPVHQHKGAEGMSSCSLLCV